MNSRIKIPALGAMALLMFSRGAWAATDTLCGGIDGPGPAHTVMSRTCLRNQEGRYRGRGSGFCLSRG